MTEIKNGRLGLYGAVDRSNSSNFEQLALKGLRHRIWAGWVIVTQALQGW